MKYRKDSNRLRIRRALAAIGVVLLVGGALAYKTLFTRPGEDAFAVIPSDALAVGSIDLTPSPAQVPLFKRIEDAINRNKLDVLTEKGFVDLFDSNPSADKVRPYALRRNAAFALLKSDSISKDSEPWFAMLIPLTDADAANAMLIKNETAQFFKGMRYYHWQRSSTFGAVIGKTLVVANAYKPLFSFYKVSRGESASITTNPEFLQARSKLVGDPNVMALISPKAFEEQKVKGVREWSSISISLRDEGIAMEATGAFDPSSDQTFNALSRMSPLKSSLFSALPNGAYGVISVAQPSALLDVARAQFGKVSDFDKSFQDGMGMDYPTDVAPGLKGDAILAAYPIDGPSAKGADVLAVLDDQNGATPDASIKKLVSYLRDQTIKNDKDFHGEPFLQESYQGVPVTKLADQLCEQTRKNLFKDSADSVDKAALVDQKILSFAVLGHTVVGSTNLDLLHRAINSYQGKGESLAKDPAYADFTNTNGQQMVAVFSLSRIADGVQNTIRTQKWQDNDQKFFGDLISV